MWKLTSSVFLYRPQDEGVAQIKGVCSRFNLWIKGELGVVTQTFNPSTVGVNQAGGSLLVAWSTKWVPMRWEEKCGAREMLVIYKITDTSRTGVTYMMVVIYFILFYFILFYFILFYFILFALSWSLPRNHSHAGWLWWLRAMQEPASRNEAWQKG